MNTLILVHRAELLRQWRERLQTFLAAASDEGQNGPNIGAIGGGKSKPTGQIDIALMQSLCRQGEINAPQASTWPDRCGGSVLAGMEVECSRFAAWLARLGALRLEPDGSRTRRRREAPMKPCSAVGSFGVAPPVGRQIVQRL